MMSWILAAAGLGTAGFSVLFLLTLLGVFGQCEGASERRVTMLARVSFRGILICEILCSPRWSCGW